jgi:hypothetical protein
MIWIMKSGRRGRPGTATFSKGLVGIASTVLLVALLTGCSVVGHYQRYERPELFYPTTAILKQQLDQAVPPGMTPPAPKPQAGEPVAPAPPSQSLAPAAEQVTPSPPAGVEPLDVLSVVEIASDDKTVRELRVSDQCPSGQVPIIQVEPAAMIVTRFALEAGTTRWFKATFDVSKVPGYIGDLEITVISCAAASLSAARARAAGLLKTVTVRVGYRRLVTKYNIWSDGDVQNEFGVEFANTFIVADAVFENPNGRPILVYGSSLAARVRFLASVESVRKVLGENAIKHPALLNEFNWGNRPASEALDFWEYYRPMAYSDILAIFSYQQESDPRQRAISTLKSIGEVASAAAVFLTAADYGTGVALFTGVVIPELEKQLLWDVLKHLKNLESRSLKEVEEVPERGELRRVVFFPRRAIPHFLPPFPMYISEITIDDVPVKAVLLDKRATISGGSGAGPGAQ